MRISIINGPNLNLLGKREPEHYGNNDLETIIEGLIKAFPEVEFTHFQSNGERELIDRLQEDGFRSQGIVFNAGAYTHTSLAIADAIAAIEAPVVEVHLSNVYSREEIRHHSLIAAQCRGAITGFGAHSYHLAVQALIQR